MKNLYKKLKLVFSEVGTIEKDMQIGKDTSKYKYMAVSESSVLNAVKPAMQKHGIMLLPIRTEETTEFNQVVVNETYNGKTTEKVKTTVFTKIQSYFMLVDCDSGESIEVSAPGHGMDSGDKSIGKAFTYSYKNLITKLFMLFSGEDTDNHPSGELDPPQDNKKKAGTTITTQNKVTQNAPKTATKIVRTVLLEYNSKVEPDIEFIIKWLKQGDHTDITEQDKKDIIEIDSRLDIWGNK